MEDNFNNPYGNSNQNNSNSYGSNTPNMSGDYSQRNQQFAQQYEQAYGTPAPEHNTYEQPSYDNNGYNVNQYNNQSYPQYGEPVQQNNSKGFAIASLVLGILSVVCCCADYLALIMSVLALVFGFLSIKKQEASKSLAIAGMILGGIGLLLFIITIISSLVYKNNFSDYQAMMDYFNSIANS